MAEKVITCPVCFDNDHCFEEVQDEWSSYICFRCGYTSNSMYKTDPSIYSINLLFDSYSRILTISNLNYTNYKIGFFYRQMKNIGNVDYDYGLSVEYGARLINKNYFSIFLRMGNKSHNYIELDNEEYYLVGLRLENIEKWKNGNMEKLTNGKTWKNVRKKEGPKTMLEMTGAKF